MDEKTLLEAAQYIKSLVKKWKKLDIPEQVIQELKTYDKHLLEFVGNALAIHIMLVETDKDAAAKEAELQLLQVIFPSFYFGLELGSGIESKVEIPDFGESVINIICFPMLAYGKKLIDSMRELNELSEENYEKYFRYLAEISIGTANKSYELGLAVGISLRGVDIELVDYVNRINPLLSKLYNTMVKLGEVGRNRPSFFGRNKWENSIVLLAIEFRDYAKQIVELEKPDKKNEVYHYLTKLSTESEAMVNNVRSRNIAKVEINQYNIGVYMMKLASIFEKLDSQNLIKQ